MEALRRRSRSRAASVVGDLFDEPWPQRLGDFVAHAGEDALAGVVDQAVEFAGGVVVDEEVSVPGEDDGGRRDRPNSLDAVGCGEDRVRLSGVSAFYRVAIGR